MTPSVGTQPSKDQFYLVRIYWGSTDPREIRLTSFNEPVGDYEPDPKMRLQLPTYGGTLDPEPIKITLSLDSGATNSEFLPEMAAGRAFPSTRVEIQQKFIGEDGQEITAFLCDGDMHSATRNPRGRSGTLRITVSQEMAKVVDHSSSVQANPECTNTFREPKTCSVSSADSNPVGEQVLDITGGRITTQASHVHDLWKRGYLEYNGASMRIREYAKDAVNNYYFLGQLPPVEWTRLVTVTSPPFVVNVFPGCLKSREHCEFYLNAENFKGSGLLIPAYNPLFESP
jgi:hypothetical protein